VGEVPNGLPQAQNGGYTTDSDNSSREGEFDEAASLEGDDADGCEFFFCTLCLEEKDGNETTRGDVVAALAHIMGHWPDNDLHMRPVVSLV
jgi:hypothetical protein